jgi:hypothetical protein
VRIDRFDRAAALAPQPPDPGVPASTLLGTGQGGDDVLEWLESEILDDRRPLESWQHVLETFATRTVMEMAGGLSRSALASGAAPSPALGSLLDAVRHGRGARMVEPLLNPALSPEHRPRAAHEVQVRILAAAVTAALLTAGRAHYRLSWSGPAQLVLGGASFDAEAAVAPAVADPRQVDSLEQWLVAQGVDLAAGANPLQEPDPQPLAAVVCVVTKRSHRANLVMFDTGLMALQADRVPWYRLSLGNRQAQRESEQLMPLVEQGFKALGNQPGAQWYGTEDIVAAKIGNGSQGWKLSLRLRDGREVTYSANQQTAELGPAMTALGEMLGHRLSKEAWRSRRSHDPATQDVRSAT